MMRQRRVVLLEDDPHQASDLEDILVDRGVYVTKIHREREFRLRLDELTAESAPDLFIIDVMCAWSRPNEPAPPPEIDQDGFSRAGFRCLDLLLKHPHTARTPVILYSILETEDVSSEVEKLPKHVTFVEKDLDGASLVQCIETVLG